MKRQLTALLCFALLAGCTTGASSPDQDEPINLTLEEYSSGDVAGQTQYELNTPYAFMAPDGGLRLFYAFQIEDENQITQVVAQERCYPNHAMVVGEDGISQIIDLKGKRFVCVDAGTSGASKGGIADLVGDGLVAVSIPAASALFGLSMPSDNGDTFNLEQGQGQGQDQKAHSDASAKIVDRNKRRNHHGW